MFTDDSVGVVAPIVVLWTASSGYLLACLEALAIASRRQVVLVCFKPDAEAPFQQRSTSNVRIVDADDQSGWQPLIEDAAGILVCGWHIAAFRRAARRAARTKQSVLFFDNQWHGAPRQQLARIIAPLYLRPAYTSCFLPGQRQALFAQRLGLGRLPLRLGAYSADVNHFAASAELTAGTAGARRRFVFVGRANPVKGLDVLTAAYLNYRDTATNPWGLLLVGQGHDSTDLSSVRGVECLPFVQPRDLPQVLARAGCFVMPSHFEPWGVALHEASAAGLALIASSAVGAADAFIRDGENGHLFEPGDVSGLARCLALVTESSAGDLEQAGQVSRRLSLEITPAAWASRLLELLQVVTADHVT